MILSNILPPGIWGAQKGGLWGNALPGQPPNLRPKLHGSVQHVLSGLAHQHAAFVNPASFRFAIGCGTVTGAVDEQGELIIVGGRAYVKPTGEHFGKVITSSSQTLLSPFAVGVDSEQTAERFFHMYVVGGMPFGELIASLASDPDGNFFYVGLAHFSRLQTAAIKRAPIEGRPIDQSYWAEPVTVENQTAIVCGMAASGRNVDPQVFYQNPAEPPQRRELLTHTHVLRYANPAQEILAANTEEGLVTQLPDQPPQIDVGHLLAQSVVSRASLAVF